MCLSKMTVIWIKQHVSSIWRSIHEKVSNTETELKETLLIKKKRVGMVKLSVSNDNPFNTKTKIAPLFLLWKKHYQKMLIHVNNCVTPCLSSNSVIESRLCFNKKDKMPPPPHPTPHTYTLIQKLYLLIISLVFKLHFNTKIKIASLFIL